MSGFLGICLFLFLWYLPFFVTVMIHSEDKDEILISLLLTAFFSIPGYIHLMYVLTKRIYYKIATNKELT